MTSGLESVVNAASVDQPPGTAPSRDTQPARVVRALVVFVAVTALCVFVYLAAAIPQSWFPGVQPRSYPASDLSLTRGTGAMDKGALVVTALDASGSAVIALNASFRSADYIGITWIAADLTTSTKADLLWRSDYMPDRVNAVPLQIASGQLVPIILRGNPAWVGNITGLALSLRGSLPQPTLVRGLTASPLGAADTLRDRLHEWLALETWSGTSINSVTGGADVQSLPLPVLVALAAVLSAAFCWLAYRRGWKFAAVAPPIAIATVFVVAWLVLDARWIWNLARQSDVTWTQYGGKSWRDKHLAADDAPLFAFVEKVRANLQSPQTRVIVMADEPYFRGRAAYHLFPYNVYYSAFTNNLPRAAALKVGDAILVYQRRGVQFDAGNGILRWDGDQTRKARLVLADHGAALFIVE